MVREGPIGKRVANRLGKRANKLRNRPGKFTQEKLPNPPNRNIRSSTVAGAAGAGLATVLEDVIGAPFGATVDITNVESGPDGDVYTVNVNSPTENIAEARAFMDSTTGFASYITDTYDIEEMEVLNKRPMRDTYQVKLRVVR